MFQFVRLSAVIGIVFFACLSFWPALDEDISVQGLLEGRQSGESQRSFEEWLRRRQQV